MTVMIALVGGQPLPNLLPARHYHPSSIILAYTQTTKKVYDKLKATLQQETAVYGLETDAYDIVAIVETLNKKLEAPEFVKQPLVFNLTGGTKAMALAAYQVAQQRKAPILYLESEGKRSRVYRYIWEHQQLKADNNELLPECVNLKDLLNVYLGVGKWKEHGPANNEGSRFEAAVAKALGSYGYEVMAGIKTMTDQIDIDVAVRFENQFGILEAKSKDSGRNLDGIKQLHTASKHLSTYTKTFYVITVPPSKSHKAIMDASDIQIISLLGYDYKSDTLSEEDAVKLVDIVDKALKG